MPRIVPGVHVLVIARVVLSGVLVGVAVIGGAVALLMHGPAAGFFVLMLFLLLGGMVAPDPEG